ALLPVFSQGKRYQRPIFSPKFFDQTLSNSVCCARGTRAMEYLWSWKNYGAGRIGYDPFSPGKQMDKRKISAKELVSDIKSGMTDAQLMAKHELTAKGLEGLFSKLIQA